jgi:DNA-binding transcriptional LysR family regulator
MALNTRLLDGIAIFVEVVNSGSFTHAASSTGHSTSFISKEISKLEDRIGVRLLHRTTRTLKLTPEGEIYYKQCQQLIDDAIEAENAVSGKTGRPRGRLRVSCPVAFGISRLQPYIPDYLSRFPEIELELDLNDRKVDLIADGFDIVIRATHQLEDSSLVSRKIQDSSSLTLASPVYLQKHGIPVSPLDLERHKVINYSNLANPGQWVYRGKGDEPVRVHVESGMMSNNSEMILAMAIAGLGIIRLPEFILTDELESGKLVTILDDYDRNPIGVYMVYPTRKHMSAKVRSFIDFTLAKLS